MDLTSNLHVLSPEHQQSTSLTLNVAPVNEEKIPLRKPSSYVQISSEQTGRPEQSKSSATVTVKFKPSKSSFSILPIQI